VTAPLVPNTPADYTETTPMTSETRTTSDEQSIGGLIAEVADDVSKLFRQEVELAKAEIKQEATKAGKAAGMLGGAGFAGYMVALFASLALMFALDAVMPTGWAAVIVAAIWGIVAAVLFAIGRKRMKEVSPVPQQTVETLKEDAQWLRNPTG
jgi:VIT1/CCC1 family predicted Fe2+/Mn2+ transporter